MKLVLRMVLVLAVITMSSAAILSSLQQWAEPRIEAHAEKNKQKAIFKLVPETDDFSELAAYKDDKKIYVCYDKNEDITGFAFEAAGTGYQGEIKLMAGLTPELEKMSGLEILAQVETPGLGAEITKYNSNPKNKSAYKFLNWFENLKIQPEIQISKDPQSQKSNQIQAITGATISSKAVVRILNRAIEKAGPRIKEWKERQKKDE
ncbi:MAG: FMN-binding protein [bacterium]